MTLEEVLIRLEGSPVSLGVKFALATTHDERNLLIEQIADNSYLHLVDSRQHNQAHTEDALTLQIIGFLKAAGLPAAHDAQIGGHVDIVVEANDNYRWIAEAKIHRQGYGYILAGFDQLTTRYGLAQVGRDHGELIIYMRDEAASRALGRWRDHLVANRQVVVTDDMSATAALMFRTTHKCRATGCDFYVRHRIIPMFHQPLR